MRKILVLIENELLAQLYKTNLSVYLESKIFRCSNFQSYKQIFTTLNDYDLIVAQSTFDSVDMRKEFSEEKQARSLPSIILVGDNRGDDDVITATPDFFNIQSLLTLAGKKLKVTAQMMASYVVPDYYPIDIEFIYYLDKAPTSLYLELNGEYVMFAGKGTSIDHVAQDLKEEGVQKFYIKSIERLEIVKKITEYLKDKLLQNSQLTLGQKTEIVSQGFDFFVNNFVRPEAAGEIIFMAKNCTRVMTDIVSESPDLQTLFFAFRNHKNTYAYIHTMLGAYVSTHIVRNLPWGGESQVDKLNFVFFFHDIYLAPIYAKYPHLRGEESLLNSEELSRHEKHTVINHARMAAELLQGLKQVPMGSDQLIKQHHGIFTGMGFAEEYKDDISPLAKIIIIAEAFVEYYISCVESNPANHVDMVEAIQFLNEKFKKNSYKKIVETLLTLRI